MIAIVLSKVLSELFLILAVGALLGAVEQIPLLSLLLISVSSIVIIRCSNLSSPWKLILSCILAALPCVLIRTSGDAAVITLCMLLLFSETRKDRALPEEWRYRRFFMIGLSVTLLCALIASSVKKDGALSTALFLMFLIASVYCLRQCRLGLYVSWRARLQDLAVVTAVPLSALIIPGLFLGFRGVIRKIFSILFYPFAWILKTMLQPLAEKPWTLPPESTAPTEAIADATDNIQDTVQNTEILVDSETASVVTRIILIVLAAVLVYFLVLLLIRLLRRPQTRRPVHSNWEKAESEPIPAEDRAQKKQSSARRKVRKIYADYLILLQSVGYFRKQSHTSLDVLSRTEADTEKSAAEALREIYLRARYHSDLPVPENDPKKMQNAYVQIKSEVDRRKKPGTK